MDMDNSIKIKIDCSIDTGIHGKYLDNMPFVPVVGDRIKVGGAWKEVVKRAIELNNLGWDGTSSVEITVA